MNQNSKPIIKVITMVVPQLTSICNVLTAEKTLLLKAIKMSHDFSERGILRMARKYTENEVIAGLQQMLSNAEVELGKSKSYIAELEDKNKAMGQKIHELEQKINNQKKEL